MIDLLIYISSLYADAVWKNKLTYQYASIHCVDLLLIILLWIHLIATICICLPLQTVHACTSHIFHVKFWCFNTKYMMPQWKSNCCMTLMIKEGQILRSPGTIRGAGGGGDFSSHASVISYIINQIVMFITKKYTKCKTWWCE